MAKKDILLKECARIMDATKVTLWYTDHLEKRSQLETLNELTKAVVTGELTAREAVAVALVVGYQWDIKFEGVD